MSSGISEKQAATAPVATQTAGKKSSKFVRILIALVALIGVAALVIAMQPADFRVARTAKIQAPAPAVFGQVNDFHNWQSWSPWEKLDPNLKRTYEGPAAGTGASYAWAGNCEVGEGRMTIVESRPDELIRIKLEFLKPFSATNTAEFTFQPEGEQTTVTWSMNGNKSFLCKGMGLIMDMDKMIGEQFEKGLTTLNSVSQEAPSAEPAVQP